MERRLPRFFLPRLVWPSLTLLAAAAAGSLYFVDPRVAGNYPACPFLLLTGCYCPGCGTLRALHRLLHGDVGSALGYNPLAVLMLPFLSVAGIDGVARAFGKVLLPDFNTLPHQLAWGLLAGIILFWALRNIPVYPFTILAP